MDAQQGGFAETEGLCEARGERGVPVVAAGLAGKPGTRIGARHEGEPTGRVRLDRHTERRVGPAGAIERRRETRSLERAGALGQHGEVHRGAAVEKPEEGLGAVQGAGEKGLHGLGEGYGPPVCPRATRPGLTLRIFRDGYSQWGV
ncbi:MAG: hypothetical protein IPH30_02735 [Betaproteobacteria bacterium]|nr:hypothetical protein [Betaproteobacteria bacterium]